MATLIKSTNGVWRVYKTRTARKSALTQMNRSGKYNYFSLYMDVRGPALHAANADWLKEGQVHIG